MTRKFCDRCGVECNSLTDIKIPIENHGHGSYSTKTIEVCLTLWKNSKINTRRKGNDRNYKRR
jgi:hypothetical protein